MAAPLGNKFALGSGKGRPLHFETPDDLAREVMAYFQSCSDHSQKSTVTGLALWLGFKSRASFDDYEKRGEDFSYIIARAKLAVENSYELSGTNFDIFALKNMGWKDKTESEISGPGGGAIQNELQIKIIRDKGNRTTPGDTASESATGTGSGETV